MPLLLVGSHAIEELIEKTFRARSSLANWSRRAAPTFDFDARNLLLFGSQRDHRINSRGRSCRNHARETRRQRDKGGDCDQRARIGWRDVMQQRRQRSGEGHRDGHAGENPLQYRRCFGLQQRSQHVSAAVAKRHPNADLADLSPRVVRRHGIHTHQRAPSARSGDRDVPGDSGLRGSPKSPTLWPDDFSIRVRLSGTHRGGIRSTAALRFY